MFITEEQGGIRSMTPAMPTWKKRLIARLRELRQRSGFTQAAAGETVEDASARYIKFLESDEIPDTPPGQKPKSWNPGIEVLHRLMNLYGCTLHDLFIVTADPPDYKGEAHDQLEYILTHADPGDREAILKAIRAFHELVIRQRKG